MRKRWLAAPASQARRVGGAALFGAVALTGCRAGPGGDIDPFSEVDRAAVRAVERGYAARWRVNDPRAVMATLTPDALVVPDGRTGIRGDSANRAFWWPEDGPRTGVTSCSTTIEEVGGREGVAFDSIFRLRELTRGVWAALVRPDPGAYAFANSLVVAGDDGVLVVDTQQSPTAAQALATEIESLIDVPVRWVVNTHWHGDHVYGNQVYRARHPGVRFVGHATLRRDLTSVGARRLDELRARIPERIAARRRVLARGTRANGTPLTADERRRLCRSLRLDLAYRSRLATVELVPPDTTFERRMELDLGGRRVVLHHFGPAHTAGDVVVHLPAEGIVAAGDLVEQGLPYVDDADLRGWRAALDSVATLAPDVVLPSHGAVVPGDRLIEIQRELFRGVIDHADTGPRSATAETNAGVDGLVSVLAPGEWALLGVDPSDDPTRIVEWLKAAVARTRSDLR